MIDCSALGKSEVACGDIVLVSGGMRRSCDSPEKSVRMVELEPYREDMPEDTNDVVLPLI